MTAKATRYVVFIDALETMTVVAQNKLLKILEEKDAFFICICYGEPVLPTIKSRLMHVPYRPYSLDAYVALGKNVESFYVTGGCPGLDGDSYVMETFSQVRDIILRGDVAEVYRCLGLVLEKNEKDFFSTRREFVPALLSYVGKLLCDKGAALEVLEYVVDASVRSATSRYTQADFFLDLAYALEYGGNGYVV